MNHRPSPLQTYQGNLDDYNKQASATRSKISVIGWVRLAIALTTVGVVVEIWGQPIWAIVAVGAAGTACFLLVVSHDVNLKNKLANLEKLLKINEDEIQLLNNNFSAREDGKQFEPASHPYSQDMDVFGPSSLYQYINRCTSQQAKQLLASKLLSPAGKHNIVLAQEAASELAGKTAWRQQFNAYGLQQPVSFNAENKIKSWLQKPAIFANPAYIWLARIYPLVTLGCIPLYLFGVLTAPQFYALVIVFLLFAFSLSKKIHATWVLLNKIVPEVETLHQQLKHFEGESFNSTLTASIKNSLQSGNSLAASTEILRLKEILNRFDVRLNIFAFYFLNTFLLWDLWQVLALNDWKKQNQPSVPNWFAAIAEMEVISSIATLMFNQPTWCLPVIEEQHFVLRATELGHPLIAAGKRVNNSFALQGTGKVSIVTGSNMGGKSTFLRSMGVNTLLALMGAPVCAEAFAVSPVLIMSSMRIADNLAESTSTFYAELKRLKSIIEAVNRKEKIFILLDEILRGTNSLDRHTGSKALIKQLIQHNAVAVAATHDVELARLQDEYPLAISNYHFDVQVENEELYFDYKLKPGVCKTLNASILMKKIGIELVD